MTLSKVMTGKTTFGFSYLVQLLKITKTGLFINGDEVFELPHDFNYEEYLYCRELIQYLEDRLKEREVGQEKQKKKAMSA